METDSNLERSVTVLQDIEKGVHSVYLVIHWERQALFKLLWITFLLHKEVKQFNSVSNAINLLFFSVLYTFVTNNRKVFNVLMKTF